VVSSNYGEAGALARYGPEYGITTVYSAHNQLYYQSRPPDSATVAVVVGGELHAFRSHFDACRVRARLHNGVGVHNEEQGEPVAVCRGMRASWARIWPAFQHYD
jgi:hypothetical protein